MFKLSIARAFFGGKPATVVERRRRLTTA